MSFQRSRFFRASSSKTRSKLYVAILDSDVAKFIGDVAVTSTSANFEGINPHKANWWGFAGRNSADSSINKVDPGLAARARRLCPSGLALGECLLIPTEITNKLQMRFVAHTALPPYEGDHRPLHAAYRNCVEAVHHRLQLDEEFGIRHGNAVCFTALGCGIRGYPVTDTSFHSVVGGFVERNSMRGAAPTLIEFRLWETSVYLRYLNFCEILCQRDVDVCVPFALKEVDEIEIVEEVFGGKERAMWLKHKLHSLVGNCVKSMY